MARTGLKKIIKGEGSGSGKKSATNRPQRNGGTAATHAAVTASAKKRNASQKTTATRKMMPRTTTHNTRDDSKRELLDRDFANSHPGSRKIMLDKKVSQRQWR